MFECIAPMVGGVPCGVHKDGHEGMDAPKLVVGYFHQDG
jgi:hypothetical protein